MQVCLCEDPSVLGTPFYLMQHVKGRIFTDPRLPGMPPAQRAAVYQVCAGGSAAGGGALSLPIRMGCKWLQLVPPASLPASSSPCLLACLPAIGCRPWPARWQRSTACNQQRWG